MTDAENMALQARIGKLIEEIDRSEQLLTKMDAAMAKVREDLEDLGHTRERLSKSLSFQKTTLAMVYPGPAFLDAQSSH